MWNGTTILALENGAIILEMFGIFLKLNIYLQHDPASPVLGIYPREMKTYAHLKILYKSSL